MPGPAAGADGYDLVVVGSGPAGASTALAALRARPGLSVALVDAAAFPRDKPCGDGVAPHVLDLLASVGVGGLLDDRVPVSTLRLARGPVVAERTMSRPAYVVPRTLFDDRLRAAALAAGAVPVRARVRALTQRAGERSVVLETGPDGPTLRARLVVGADGANGVTRRCVGAPRGPSALALRGYAPVRAEHARTQVIVFGTTRQPSYAWSFDRGDGLANVGYGELLGGGRSTPTRSELLGWLEALLPGATGGGHAWRAHHLPLSTARPLRPGAGRVLLAGDAAGLVNPLTGEGIYYAVATGLLAGAAAAAALTAAGDGDGRAALPDYTTRARRLLGGHLRHTALAASLSRSPAVLEAGLAAAGRDQAVFDDLVELGLARGRLTGRTAGALAGALLERARPRSRATLRPPSSTPTGGETPCGS